MDELFIVESQRVSPRGLFYSRKGWVDTGAGPFRSIGPARTHITKRLKGAVTEFDGSYLEYRIVRFVRGEVVPTEKK